MNNTNNYSARQAYDIARRILYNAFIGDFQKANPNNGAEADRLCWLWVNSRKLSQGEIRLEVKLNAANNIFTFGVTPTQANSNNIIFPTEQRLPLQDSLICSEHSLQVCNPTSDTDTNFNLFTYGNTQAFSAGAAAAIDNTLYANGTLQVKVNNDTVIPGRPLRNHKYVPQTQQTAALGAGSPKDQYRGAEDGFITDEPNFILIGSKNYVPQIVLPGAMPTVDTFERAVLIFSGIYAQNSTSIN